MWKTNLNVAASQGLPPWELSLPFGQDMLNAFSLPLQATSVDAFRVTVGCRRAPILWNWVPSRNLIVILPLDGTIDLAHTCQLY